MIFSLCLRSCSAKGSEICGELKAGLNESDLARSRLSRNPQFPVGIALHVVFHQSQRF